jgi:hypothetical protein
MPASTSGSILHLQSAGISQPGYNPVWFSGACEMPMLVIRLSGLLAGCAHCHYADRKLISVCVAGG